MNKSHHPVIRLLLRLLLRLLPFALLAASALVLLPLLRRDLWPLSHEKSRYPILLDHFREAFLQGQWYPRWLPRLNGGYGYPTFVFYQPGFFFFALPFALLPLDPLLVFKLVVWALFFLGASGIYSLCRELSRAKVAFACALLFLLTPYLFVELYVRNDLSELMAMVLFPWSLAFSCRLNRRVRQGASASADLLGLSAATALLVFSHPAVALFAIPFSGAIAFHAGGTGPTSARNAVWLRLAIGLGAGIALSASYWFTVLRMEKYVNMEVLTSGYYEASTHVVSWSQYFSNAWGFGHSGGQGGPMSFQLGLPHTVLALVGLAAGWRSRMVRAAFFGYVLLLCLMSGLARHFWALPIETLRRVQFPWRLLALTATLQVLCAAGLGAADESVHGRHGSRLAVVALGVFLALSPIWYGQEFFPRKAGIPLRSEIAEKRAFDLRSWQWYADLDEFRPKTLKKRPALPRQSTPPLVVPSGASAAASSASNDSHLRYQIEASEPIEIGVHQSYLPGWRVLIDARDVPRELLEADLTDEGWMRISIPPGSHAVEAFYDGPPGWRWQALLSMLVLVGLAGFCLRDWRHRAAPSRAHQSLDGEQPAPPLGP
jgi:hypothetical protein